ncbi:MAG: hypothetical protein JW395_0469 [Nitrospira sp.]|nr:hypothetical protein [Nitrospira sp.]
MNKTRLAHLTRDDDLVQSAQFDVPFLPAHQLCDVKGIDRCLICQGVGPHQFSLLQIRIRKQLVIKKIQQLHAGPEIVDPCYTNRPGECHSIVDLKGNGGDANKISIDDRLGMCGG